VKQRKHDPRPVVTWPDPKPGSVWFIPGDPHFGAQDDRAHEVAAQCAEDAGASLTLSLGDTFDYWALSDYPKEAHRFETGALADEAAAALPWIERWRGFSQVHLAPGNHEERWYRFTAREPAYARTEWQHPVEQVLRHVVTSYLPRGYQLVVGKASAQHGHNLTGHKRGAPADSLGTVLKHYPNQNTWYGHVHRVGFRVKSTWKHGRLEYHSVGCVGHLESLETIGEYAPDAQMQQGFALVRWFAGGHFTFIPHEIHVEGKTGRKRVLRSPATGKEYRA
jgi:hypothetical protein